MKKVYLLHYSQLIPSHINTTLLEFYKHTRKPLVQLGLLAHKQGGSSLNKYNSAQELQEMQEGCIYKYKTGQINQIEFCEQMNMVLGTDLSFSVFKTCWNAMCTISPETKMFLSWLESMQQEQDFMIHVLASTNSMHVEYIDEQLNMAGINNLRIAYTFSFETGTLELQLPADLYSTDHYEIVNLVPVKNDAVIDEFKRLLEANKSSRPLTLRV